MTDQPIREQVAEWLFTWRRSNSLIESIVGWPDIGDDLRGHYFEQADSLLAVIDPDGILDPANTRAKQMHAVKALQAEVKQLRERIDPDGKLNEPTSEARLPYLHPDGEYISIGIGGSPDTLLKVGGQEGAAGWRDKERAAEWCRIIRGGAGPSLSPEQAGALLGALSDPMAAYRPNAAAYLSARSVLEQIKDSNHA